MTASALFVILIAGVASLGAGIILTLMETRARRLAAGSATSSLDDNPAAIDAPGSQLNPAGVLSRMLADVGTDETSNGYLPDWQVAGGAVVIGVATALLLWWVGAPAWLALMAGAVAALCVPSAILAWARERHERALLDEFPSVVAIFQHTVRSGAEVSAGILAAAAECKGPLGREFIRVAEQVSAGVPPDAALAEASDRVGLAEFDLLCAAVKLQDEALGGPVATWEHFAETLRRRREIQIRAGALRSRLRMTSYVLVGVLMGALAAASLLAPHFLVSFLLEPSGRLVLSLALVGLFAGLYAMHTIAGRGVSA